MTKRLTKRKVNYVIVSQTLMMPGKARYVHLHVQVHIHVYVHKIILYVKEPGHTLYMSCTMHYLQCTVYMYICTCTGARSCVFLDIVQ